MQKKIIIMNNKNPPKAEVDGVLVEYITIKEALEYLGHSRNCL